MRYQSLKTKSYKPWDCQAFAFVFGLITILGTSHPAHAWCHSSDLNETYYRAHLLFPLAKKHEIKFCTQVEDKHFSAASIGLQTRAALKLWLDAIAWVEPAAVISETTCDDLELNLKVEVSSRNVDLGVLQPYQIPVIEARRQFSKIKINPDYLEKQGKKTYKIVDFLNFANGDITKLEKLLEDLSFKRKVSIRNFAARRAIPFIQIYNTTYPTIIHELGHSFGLADTIGNLNGCDLAQSSGKRQPDSIMKFPANFFLSTDDVAGVQSIYMRFFK